MAQRGRFNSGLGESWGPIDGSPWMTKAEAQEYLGLLPPDLDELIRTGQVDTIGVSANLLILRKSVATYRRLREQIG